ncbi:TPA: hypothetical protein ACGFB9_004955, partial [Escherichia coli]
LFNSFVLGESKGKICKFESVPELIHDMTITMSMRMGALLIVINSPDISKLSCGQLIHLSGPAMISLSRRFILSPFLSVM